MTAHKVNSNNGVMLLPGEIEAIEQIALYIEEARGMAPRQLARQFVALVENGELTLTEALNCLRGHYETLAKTTPSIPNH